MAINALSNPVLPPAQRLQDPRMNADQDGSSWVGTALKATGTALWLLASIASFVFLGPLPGLVVTVGGLAVLLGWTGCSCSSDFWNSISSSNNDMPPMGRRNYVAIASGAPPPMWQPGGRYVQPAPAPHVAVGAGHFVPAAPPPVYGMPPAVAAPHVGVGAGHFNPPPPAYGPAGGAPHVPVGAGHGHLPPASLPPPPVVAAPAPAVPHVAVGAGHFNPPPQQPPAAAPATLGTPHVGVGTRRGPR